MFLMFRMCILIMHFYNPLLPIWTKNLIKFLLLVSIMPSITVRSQVMQEGFTKHSLGLSSTGLRQELSAFGCKIKEWLIFQRFDEW